MGSCYTTQKAQPDSQWESGGVGQGGVGGRFKREGTYVCLWLIHTVVWKKPTQHYEAIILQLKIKLKTISGTFKREKKELVITDQHNNMIIFWRSLKYYGNYQMWANTVGKMITNDSFITGFPQTLKHKLCESQ